MLKSIEDGSRFHSHTAALDVDVTDGTQMSRQIEDEPRADSVASDGGTCTADGDGDVSITADNDRSRYLVGAPRKGDRKGRDSIDRRVRCILGPSPRGRVGTLDACATEGTNESLCVGVVCRRG